MVEEPLRSLLTEFGKLLGNLHPARKSESSASREGGRQGRQGTHGAARASRRIYERYQKRVAGIRSRATVTFAPVFKSSRGVSWLRKSNGLAANE